MILTILFAVNATHIHHFELALIGRGLDDIKQSIEENVAYMRNFPYTK